MVTTQISFYKRNKKIYTLEAGIWQEVAFSETHFETLWRILENNGGNFSLTNNYDLKFAGALTESQQLILMKS